MRLFKREAIIYKSCETIPVYNFFKLMQTDDLNWLVQKKGYIPDFANDTKEDLLDEYILLSKDEVVAEMLQKKAFILSSEVKIKICSYCLNVLSNGQENATLIAILKKWRIKINPKKDLLSEVRRGIQTLQTIQDKCQRLRAELDEKGEKELLNIEKESVYLSKMLELNYSIDTKTTSAAQWVAYKELLKEKKK